MELVYSEIYAKDLNDNGYCLPLVQFRYKYDERNLLPSSKYLIEEHEDDSDNYIAYVPFFNTFFDGLKIETLSKLKSILDFSYKFDGSDYISKNIWKPFLFTSNIEIKNIKKRYNTHLEKVLDPNSRSPLYRKYNKKSTNQLEVEKYYNSRVLTYNQDICNIQTDIYRKLSTHFTNNIKPTLKTNYITQKARDKDLHILSIMKQGVFGGIMNIDYSFEFQNEKDLLYMFLECIFQSEYNYKIKQCNKCADFFITLDTKTKHCPNCLPIVKKLQKLNYENKDIVKIERKVNQLFYAPNRLNEKDLYFKTKKSKKEDLVNGIITEEEYIKWLLSHYRTKNK